MKKIYQSTWPTIASRININYTRRRKKTLSPSGISLWNKSVNRQLLSLEIRSKISWLLCWPLPRESWLPKEEPMSSWAVTLLSVKIYNLIFLRSTQTLPCSLTLKSKNSCFQFWQKTPLIRSSSYMKISPQKVFWINFKAETMNFFIASRQGMSMEQTLIPKN